MQICHPPPPPSRPLVWTLLPQESSFQGLLQERSLENSNMSFLQRRVRWWRPTAQMKKRPQGGISLAALSDVNLHQGNMLVNKWIMNPYPVRIKGILCWIICFDPADEEGVRYVPVKPRPPITLLRHYRNPWKAAYHHFQRYSDIRVKGMLQQIKIHVFQHLKVKNINPVSGKLFILTFI